MSMVERGDEVSPKRLLPTLRKIVKAGGNLEAVHDLRANLGYWLCTQYFTEVELPSQQDILGGLKAAKMQHDLTVDDVLAGWYLLQLEDDPCYRVVEHLPTQVRPDDAVIAHTVQMLIAETLKSIENLKHDSDMEDELREVENELKEFQQVLVKDVRHTWNVCRKYGVPPFLTR